MDPGLERPKTPDYLKPDLLFQLQPEASVVLTSDLHLFSNADVLIPEWRGTGERGGENQRSETRIQPHTRPHPSPQYYQP